MLSQPAFAIAALPRPTLLCRTFERMRRLFGVALLPLVLMSAGLSACGDGNSLGGSMDTVFSLNFDAVEITYRQTSLVVQYTNGADVVCQVVINTSATPLAANATISGAPFVQTVSLYRAAASGGSFADVQNGTLVLGDYATTAGGTLSGKFNATLTDGHTLIGAFDSTIKSVVQ